MHRFSYDFADPYLGLTGFETRDDIERFAGFAAIACMESDKNLNMNLRLVVNNWLQQERPLG